MRVGELIKRLQAFDPESKVIIPRTESGLEDIVACYEEMVCEGRFAQYDQLDDYVLSQGADPATAEKVVVIDMSEQLPDGPHKQ